MKTKHTPEPWAIGLSKESFVNDHKVIGYAIGRFNTDEEKKANAARIVECVNACAGMENPAAEIAALRARVAELEAQVPTKPQPNWDEAPEWAMWWAVNAYGMSYYIMDKPVAVREGWGNCGNWKYAGNVNLNGFYWRETLTKRP